MVLDSRAKGFKGEKGVKPGTDSASVAKYMFVASASDDIERTCWLHPWLWKLIQGILSNLCMDSKLVQDRCKWCRPRKMNGQADHIT